ncbi:hypothetical protein C4J81_16545 [Deltaproteobacteria bacterium Smac51]|nr:hypothetical protein C4J81_16545 [Deltaproteobacteria bacterium Smac51]
MANTKIEWCDETINPVVGCSKCSPGCDNCYAERQAARLAKMSKTAVRYGGVVNNRGRWTGKLSQMDLSVFDRLPQRPCSVFIGSMTDLFHPNLDDDDGQLTRSLFSRMNEYPDHSFLILTKRPHLMRQAVEWVIAQDGELPPNCWLGVTVCNQEEADDKIPMLLSIPAVGRFVSIEPMLGGINVAPWLRCKHPKSGVLILMLT